MLDRKRKVSMSGRWGKHHTTPRMRNRELTRWVEAMERFVWATHVEVHARLKLARKLRKQYLGE